MEKYTVGDLLLTKSLEDRGTWLWCDENVPALEAVRTMTKANVGALLVMRSSVLDVDNDGVVSAEELVRGRWEDAVAGVLTERDYLRKVVAQNKDASTTAVGTIMTDKKLYDVAQTDTPVLEALRRMTEGRHRHMPVVNANRTMAGMLCIGDVTRMVVDAHRQEVLRLRDYLAGASYWPCEGGRKGKLYSRPIENVKESDQCSCTFLSSNRQFERDLASFCMSNTKEMVRADKPRHLIGLARHCRHIGLSRVRLRPILRSGRCVPRRHHG